MNKVQINNREYSLYLPLDKEFLLEANKNYLFDLSYLSIVDVKGPRAAEFLQGQLTCDLNQVNPATVRKGALCNIKGRVQALIDVIDWQGLKLILPNDLLNKTVESLAKPAMLSSVSLQHDMNYQLFGFYFNNPADILPFPEFKALTAFSALCTDDSFYYSIGDNYYIVITSSERASTLADTFINHQQMRGSLGWHRLQLERPRVEIYPESRGAFLPHRLNLHKTDYISFDKGCYKGQEIIARTHYRAKLKHMLQNFSITSTKPLCVGQKLVNPIDNTEIGELIDFCPLSSEDFLIVVSILQEHPPVFHFEGQDTPINLNSSLSF